MGGDRKEKKIYRYAEEEKLEAIALWNAIVLWDSMAVKGTSKGKTKKMTRGFHTPKTVLISVL